VLKNRNSLPNERPYIVWVVDDDPDYSTKFCNIIKQILPNAKLSVFFDSNSVLLAYSELPGSEYPNLMFLDVHLPDLNGVSLLEELQQQGIRVSTILMSQHDRANLLRQAGSTRAAAFLVKPTRFNSHWVDNVTASVNFALSRSASRDVLDREQTTNRLKIFYSGINHDFTSPIVTASLIIQDIQDKLNAVKFRGKRGLAREVKLLNKCMEDATFVIDDLTLITEEGVIKVAPEKLSPKQFARQLNDKWKPLFRDFKATVNKEVKEIYVDKNKLMRAVANVIGNSRKFQDPGSQICRVTIKQCDALETFWEIKIEDEGRGIPQQNLHLLGLIGVRGENVKDIKGSGKGLAITNRLCELHVCDATGKSGFFTIANRGDVNHGVVVCIRLPYCSKQIKNDPLKKERND